MRMRIAYRGKGLPQQSAETIDEYWHWYSIMSTVKHLSGVTVSAFGCVHLSRMFLSGLPVVKEKACS